MIDPYNRPRRVGTLILSECYTLVIQKVRLHFLMDGSCLQQVY